MERFVYEVEVCSLFCVVCVCVFAVFLVKGGQMSEGGGLRLQQHINVRCTGSRTSDAAL